MRIILAVVFLSACGKDVCDKQVDAAEDCGVPVSDAAVDECKEQIKSCSRADQKLLDNYLDCVIEGGLWDCDDGTNDTGTSGGDGDLDALFACLGELTGISEECASSAAGFGGDSG